MSLRNRPWNPLLVNGSPFGIRPQRNLLAWMLLPAVPGEEDSSDLSRRLECSSRLLPLYLSCMRHEFLKSSMPHLHPSLSQQHGDVARLLRSWWKELPLCLAYSMLCEKRDDPFPVVMIGMRCSISLALLQSTAASLCDHGAVHRLRAVSMQSQL